MSSGFTPVNQVRLTNVAYVRLNRGGKRFEIACYRNKALSWRNKIETDINEVLQIDSVFSNVSKGMLANAKDMEKAFGTSDKNAVCIEILNKGELQVSEQERAALQESVFRDIANIVVDKTLNPETNRPYTVSIIQTAMRQIQFSINTTKNSKSQALEVIRRLKEVMPIRRTRMSLRIHFPNTYTRSSGKTEPIDSSISESGSKYEAEGTIRSALEKGGALIVATSSSNNNNTSTVDTGTTGTGTASSLDTAGGNDNKQSDGSGPSGRVRFLDFEIEPDGYRTIESLIRDLHIEGAHLEILQLRSNAIASLEHSPGPLAPSVPVPTSSSAAADALPPRPPTCSITSTAIATTATTASSSANTITVSSANTITASTSSASVPTGEESTLNNNVEEEEEEENVSDIDEEGVSEREEGGGGGGDNDDDEDEDDLDAFEHIHSPPSFNRRKEKNREKKLLKRRIKQQQQQRQQKLITSTGAPDVHGDNDNDDEAGGGVDESEAAESSGSGSAVGVGAAGMEQPPLPSTGTASGTASGAASGDRKSKRNKRLEREALQERQQQARALQARLDKERDLLLLGAQGQGHGQKRQVVNQSASASAAVADVGAGAGVEGPADAAPGACSSPSTGTSTSTNTSTNTGSSTCSHSSSVSSSASSSSGSSSSGSSSSSSSSKSCNTCGGAFPDAISYRQHFRSEWHRQNLNRKMKGEPVLLEADFLHLQQQLHL